MRTLQDYQLAYRGQDKQLHFQWGFCIGAVVSLGFGKNPVIAFGAGVFFAALAGAGKEAIDAIAKREGSNYGVERADFTATLAGGVLGAGIVAVGRWLLG